MQSFLGQLSQKIIQNHPDNLDQIALVLPSRRSHLFLRKELSQSLKKSTWLPTMFSLEDFINQHHQEIQLIDNLDLTYELYLIHLKLEKDQAEPFEEFINWSSTLIQDFNEIDRYLIDAEELYDFLSEARAIEVWSPANGELSEFQQRYLSFWSKLKIYYREFRQSLLAKGLAYQGLSFRMAAENIKKQYLTEYNKIYFAGFNALTKSEEKILDYYCQNHQAEFIYDVDSYYLKQREQEAGRFLRPKSPQILEEWISNGFKNEEKKISIYAASGNIQQAKLIGDLCRTTMDSNTAVILAEESVLIPVLEGMPKSIEKINVTMGYELLNSPYFDFFEKFILLHIPHTENQTSYHAKAVIRFLKHPLWSKFSSSILKERNGILEKIKSNQWIYVPLDALDVLNQKLAYTLFKGLSCSSKQILDSLNWICSEQAKINKGSSSILDGEIIHAFHLCLNRIISFEDKLKEKLDLKALHQMYQQIVAQEKVSFIGEPLSGIQVMGVLESRSLDFERIIISNLNEGILPAGKAQNSFIPYDIKRKFGLPSYKEKDAIFAYHFYRVLQRSKDIHLIYNSHQTGLGTAEKSRFLVQLEHEIQNYNPQISIQHFNLKQKNLGDENPSLELKITSEIESKIRKHVSSRLSATAINSFLNCPLDYYYKYILNLKEEKDSTDLMELNTFGSIVHGCLESLYQPYIGKALNQSHIQEMGKELSHCLERVFLKETNKKAKFGFDRVAFEAARLYIKRIIKWDENTLKSGKEIIIHDLERNFLKKFGAAQLKGSIDRLDEVDGQIRIIDFKTGSLESKDLAFKDISTLLKGTKDKVVQLLIYLIAIQDEFPEAQAGMISCKTENPYLMPLRLKEDQTDVNELVTEILKQFEDKDLVFKHNKKSSRCNFCQE